MAFFLLFVTWTMLAYGVYCLCASQDRSIHFQANAQGLDLNYPDDREFRNFIFGYSTKSVKIPWSKFARFNEMVERRNGHVTAYYLIELDNDLSMNLLSDYWEESGGEISERLKTAFETFQGKKIVGVDKVAD